VEDITICQSILDRLSAMFHCCVLYRLHKTKKTDHYEVSRDILQQLTGVLHTIAMEMIAEEEDDSTILNTIFFLLSEYFPHIMCLTHAIIQYTLTSPSSPTTQSSTDEIIAALIEIINQLCHRNEAAILTLLPAEGVFGALQSVFNLSSSETDEFQAFLQLCRQYRSTVVSANISALLTSSDALPILLDRIEYYISIANRHQLELD
jgi:hypothetical protein